MLHDFAKSAYLSRIPFYELRHVAGGFIPGGVKMVSISPPYAAVLPYGDTDVLRKIENFLANKSRGGNLRGVPDVSLQEQET